MSPSSKVSVSRPNAGRRPAFHALLVWLICGTALGLIEMSVVGAGAEIDFSSYSLAEFMLYYWVPSALGGALAWAALAIWARVNGKKHDPLALGCGLFAAATVFVYVGHAINGMIKGSPFTPVGIGANLAVAAGAVGVGFLAGVIARWVRIALAGRRALALAIGLALSVPFIYLAWAWGNIDPGFRNNHSEAAAAGRPNVILITIDALRADRLSLNGYERPTAPYLARMAGEGANFSLALSQATITVRSMASIFTSLYPQMHGVMSSGLRITDSTLTLPEVLARAGYATAGFGGGNPSLFHDAGIVRGFDYYDDCRSIWALVPQKILSRLGLVERMDVGAARTVPHGETIFDKARSWLGHKPDRPFFLFIHLMDVHTPYLPPDGYADKFGTAPEGLPADARLNRKLNHLVVGKSELFFELAEAGEFDRMGELDVTHEDISEREMQRLSDLYDGSIAYADAQLGKFMEELSVQGILDRTLVMVTADHGESFMDHGRIFHSGDQVYDELMKVPLIMRYPKAVPPGARVDVQVRLIDVMPTALDVAGVDVAGVGVGGEPGLDMQGRSLLPLLRGDPEELDLRRDGDVYCEGALVSCVRTPRWKFIDSPGHNSLELYDLVGDPGERTNLYDLMGDAALDMWARLERYQELVRLYQESHPGPTHISVDDETRKRLRALGYVE